MYVKLIAAPDDRASQTQEYQKELRSFEESVRRISLRVYPLIYKTDSAAVDAPATYLGQFRIVVERVGPFLVGLDGLLVGWLQSRNGRVVRVRSGEVEAEAKTMKQIQELLNCVGENARKVRACRHEGPWCIDSFD